MTCSTVSFPRSFFPAPARTRAGVAALAVLAVLALPGHAAGATGAAPLATMTPSTGLVDGQHTTIRASGFRPNIAIQVLACEGTATKLPKDSRSCEGVTLDSSGYTDAKGNYLNEPGDPSGDTAGYRVAVLPSATFKVVSIRCGPDDPCVLYVGEQFNDFSLPHTFVAMSFAGARKTSGGSGGGAGGGAGGGSGGGSGGSSTIAAAGLIVTLAAGSLLWRRRRRSARSRLAVVGGRT